MTSRTLSYLNNTLLASSQPSGSITPLRMQDVIDTMNARTGGPLGGGSFVRVTDPEFGADPTGVSDSTTAFQNAMAAGPCLVPAFQSNGSQAVYTINNCIVPSGAALFSFNYSGYPGGGLGSDVFMRPKIQGLSSSVRLFNVDGTQGCRFEGLLLYGGNSSVAYTTDLISGGSRSMTIANCCLENGRFGIGGSVSGSTQTYPTAMWQGNLYNNLISSCLTGIGDLVDSFIFGGSIAFCGNGLLTTNNSSASHFTGTRFEFCGQTGITPGGAAGYGVHLVNAGLIQFNGCQWDANGNAGIYFDNAFWCSINGGSMLRNGCNVASGTTLISTSAHISLNVAYNINIANVTTEVGNPGTPNVYCPAAAMNWVGTAGNNGAVVIIANDLSGYQGSTAGATKTGPTNSNTTWKIGTVPTGSGLGALVLSKNLGTGTAAQDVDTR